MKILINDIEQKVLTDFKITDTLSYRSNTNLTIQVNDDEDDLIGEKDRIKVLNDNDDVIFFGIVEKISSPIFNTFKEPLLYKLVCNSIESVLDNRVMNQAFENTTVDVIVDFIKDNFIIPENVVSNFDIDDFSSFAVEKAVFKGASVEISLNQLARFLGATWWISPLNDTFNFKFPTNFTKVNTVPFSLTNLPIMSEFKHNKLATDLRNVQFISGALETTSEQIEKFKGDGENKTFTLGYRINKKPRIFIDTIEVSSSAIGIRGIEDANPLIEWFFTANSNQVSQKFDITSPLSSSEVLEVRYEGLFEVSIEVRNNNAIESRLINIGGTGKVEAFNKTTATSVDFAEETAMELLKRFIIPREKVIFNKVEDEVDFNDYDVGKTINFNLPTKNIVGDFVITEKKYTHYYETNGEVRLRITVTAFKGEIAKGYGNTIGKINRDLKLLNINENEVVIIAEQFEEIINFNEELIIFNQAALFASDDFPIIKGGLYLQDSDLIKSG